MTASAVALPQLTYQMKPMDMEGVDWMVDSSSLLGDPDALRQRMDTDGYLYLPGLLGRDRVTRARQTICQRLAGLGLLDPSPDVMDAVPHPTDYKSNFVGGRLDQIFADPEPINDVLYRGPLMDFFRDFLAAPVLHYDYTWMRQVMPGPATPIHSDVVYMGRGTHNLYTVWTPMGDNGFDLGGLMVLDGTHKHQGLAKQYWKSDVDTYCSNSENPRDGWTRNNGGALMGHADQLRSSLGGTWRTHDYKMGDCVVFSVYTVHGGTDNHSNQLRLSTDTRYQRAHDAVDERWVGEKPVGHGKESKRGLIC